jgi:signal transduction histidine kinase
VATAAAYTTGFVKDPAHLLLVGLALAASNLFWWWSLRHRGASMPEASLRWRLFLQLLGDTVALSLLLEFSGGAENPFAMLFSLPVAVAAMLLPTRLAISLTVLGGGTFVTVVLGQYTGLLDHHGLHGRLAQSQIVDPLYRSPRFVWGYLMAFVSTLSGITYLVRALTLRYQRAEALRREHERVAQSRERLARVGEVSAGIAHSLRNPLHGLLSSVELLRPGCSGDATATETLGLMSEALVRMEAVTQRVLSLTRDVPLQPRACDLDEVVRDVLHPYASAARPSGSELVTVLGRVGEVELDALRFTEALSNLVDNALHACRQGGVVTVSTVATGEAEVSVEVADTGEGISPADLPRVFDPFFTTKAVGEGTGLGLAMARRIVEEHGGRVALESERGRGTRVRLVVPRRRARQEPGEP